MTDKTKNIARGPSQASMKTRFMHGIVRVLALQLGAIAIGLAAPSFAAPAADITGQWMTNDIQCPAGTASSELMTFVQVGNEVVAVKVTGNACVPAGFKFLQGPWTGGNFGAVTCFSGTAGRPASSSFQGSMFVVDANHITACNVSFTRSAPTQATSGAYVPPSQIAVPPSQVGAPPSFPGTRPPPRVRPNPKPKPPGSNTASRKAEVKAVLTQVKDAFKATGVAAVVESDGSLNARSYADESLGRLQSGYEYSVVVACDKKCGEISVVVYDGGGNEVARNSAKLPVGSNSRTAAKATVVTYVPPFTPPRDQLYTARVTVSDCAKNPCEYGLLVANGPMSVAAPSPTSTPTPPPAANQRVADVQTLVATLLLEVKQAGGTLMFKSDGTDTLVNGGAVNVLLGVLQAGRAYRFEGTCDLACSDLNLGLMDANGFVNGVLDMDPNNKEPYIEFTPVAGQQYWVRVHMANCGNDPCNWALVGGSYP